MEKVIEILKELQSNSGNRLQEIIEENKDNELFLEILKFVFNPYVVTGLSKKKINKITPFYKYDSFKDILEVFDYLKSHNTGTDVNISRVQDFMFMRPLEHKEYYKQIFTKELKLGITAKTINKVIPNLIPEFNVMLAEKYGNRIEELEKNKPEIIITQKLDRN